MVGADWLEVAERLAGCCGSLAACCGSLAGYYGSIACYCKMVTMTALLISGKWLPWQAAQLISVVS